MVADTARFTHAAGRDDDLRHGVGVDGTGLIAGDADLQARELNGVDALCQQSVGLFIKAGGVGVLEDPGGLDGQRLSMYTGKQPWPVTRFFSFISRMK